MNKIKVMTIVGTRPEIIRLSRVIAKLDEHCDHALVHTGQNYDYELNQIFFDDLGIRHPDCFLEAAGEGETVAETMGKVLSATDKVIDTYQPEAILILGDTNSALAAITAKRKKVPIFHMEAGNRSFDFRVSEEINRRIVDHIADINLPYSSIAREYLLSEGIASDRIIKTGSPMFEVLNFYRSRIESSPILERLNLVPGKFFMGSTHREENVDTEANLVKLADIFNQLAENYKEPVIISTHPRTQKRITNAGLTFHPLIQLLKPLGFTDYVKLQISSHAVLSDSGTITEESSILNFPAINLREAHERPEGFEEASVMMTGLEQNRVFQALAILESQGKDTQRTLCLVHDYSTPNVSEKVLRIILSYTDYVNRVVWKKLL